MHAPVTRKSSAARAEKGWWRERCQRLLSVGEEGKRKGAFVGDVRPSGHGLWLPRLFWQGVGVWC